MNLHTARLCIRNIHPEDTGVYYALFSDPVIAQYDDYELVEPADMPPIIAQIQAGYAGHGPENQYAIALGSTGEMIGVLNTLHEADAMYIGYHILSQWHRQGYGFEAIFALVEYLSSARDKKIRAKVDPDNLPSINLLKKVGFLLWHTHKTKTGNAEHIFEYTHASPRH